MVRDAIVQLAGKRKIELAWHLPVTAETYDGWLSDAEHFPVTSDDAIAALESAKGGAVPEGNVGGGTGMICHEFKGGTGTASRRLPADLGGWTVGALVQANYGMRNLLRCGHAPVGLEITDDVVPVPERETKPKTDQGSIIVILATDAPLLPDPVPAAGAARHHGPRLGRRLRLQFVGRHLPRLLHRQRGADEVADDQPAHAGHGPMHALVPGRRRSDRGGDLERHDRGGDHDRLAGPHGQRHPARPAEAGRARATRGGTEPWQARTPPWNS